jgi:nucleotide-binding universal stress UspA family protein
MKVIIAIDQSGNWTQIIDSVLRRQWPKDTQFKILTVIAPFQWEQLDSPEWQKSAKRIYEARRLAAQSIITDARHVIQQGIPFAQVHVELKQGSPRDHIVRTAIEWMADKILLGAHGHSPNRLFGAVPRTVSAHAPCSVELVRLHKPVHETSDERSEHKSRVAI